MLCSTRVFTLPKDPEHPAEFQDAYRIDPAAGVATVADGVASAIFSGQWAELLVAAAVDGVPDPDDRPAFARWLQARRKEWSEAIDVGGLAWFQKAKLPLGAFSTLLWLQLSACGAGVSPAPAAGTAAPQAYRLRGFAIGDTCLLHVRDGQMLRSFPVDKSPEFEADPLVLGSVDLKRDHLLRFAAIDEPCRRGDLLVLCTDAVAEWGLRQSESGNTPDWASCWDLTEAQWCEQIETLRQQGEMRYDDATLVLLRVGDEVDATEIDESGRELADTLGQQSANELGRQLHCCPAEAEGGGGSTTATPTSSATATPTSSATATPTSSATATATPTPCAMAAPTAAATSAADPLPREEPTAAPVLVDEPKSAPTAAAPILVEQDDWKEKLKSLSENVSKGIDQVSDQVLRGMQSLKEKAVEKYREKFGPRKK
jgi:hypothetical protein